MAKKEYSAELTKMFEDLKYRPSAIRNRWKRLNEEERGIYCDALQEKSAKARAEFDKLIKRD